MKKYMVILPLSAIMLFVGLPQMADAQTAIAEVIKAGVTKAIKAIDLKVQAMQNKTIELQNFQKALENQLSKLKLNEISDWSQKQKELYGNYYNELWEVKSLIAYYGRIKEMTEKQTALVSQYNHAWSLLKLDQHFKPEEFSYMQKVYSGILEESVKNLDQILLVVNSFRTQMSDAKRLQLINEAADKIDVNSSDLKQFNNQNIMLSLQRAHSQDDVSTLKKYYGIN